MGFCVLHGLANPGYLGRFFFSGLLRVAPYCFPGGIRMVSKGYRGCIEAAVQRAIFLCSHCSRSARGRLISGSQLSLDTEHGQTCRRRDGRSVGLADLLVPFASPRWRVGAQPQGDVGGLHGLPNHTPHTLGVQGIQIRLVLPNEIGQALQISLHGHRWLNRLTSSTESGIATLALYPVRGYCQR